MMLDLLPVEILIQVLSHLCYRDLLTCSLVSPHRPHHLVQVDHTTMVPGVPPFPYGCTGERFLPVCN
jgi:hypothetical protein